MHCGFVRLIRHGERAFECRLATGYHLRFGVGVNRLIGLLHMEPLAVKKAERRLGLAEKALAELLACPTPRAFHDAWYAFLVPAKNVYTILEQGAKTTAQSRQWFGAKATERRSDPLLQYLYQARDDDEHGIGSVVEMAPGYLKFAGDNVGDSEIIMDPTDPNKGIMRIKSTDGKRVKVVGQLPYMTLATVTGRGGIKYHPPTEHKGAQLASNRPHEVATLALAHLRDILEEAKAMAR